MTSNPPHQEDADTALALAALRAVAADPEAPAAARGQAARTLLEVRGSLGRHAAPPATADRALASMSRAEIAAEIARLRGSASADTPQTRGQPPKRAPSTGERAPQSKR